MAKQRRARYANPTKNGDDFSFHRRMPASLMSTNVPPVEGPVHPAVSLVLLIAILAMVGCNFTASMSLLWRFAKKSNLPHHQDKTPRKPTTRGTIEEIEMSPDAYESPIIPTERQDVRVYMELN